MTSRLVEFALSKKRQKSSEESDNVGTSSSNADDIDERLKAELAMMLGETPSASNEKQLNPSTNTASVPNTISETSTKSDDSEKKSETSTSSSEKENVKKEEKLVDNNNNATGTTEKTAYKISFAPPSTNNSFEQFFPPKSKEQLEREAANPPGPKEEDLTRPWKCEECGVRLKAKTTLELHQNTKHKGIKRFACTLCDHKSAQRANLSVHMKAMHNQTEKYQCSFCEKQVDAKREIGNHVRAEHGRSIYGRGKMEDFFKEIYVTFIAA